MELLRFEARLTLLIVAVLFSAHCDTPGENPRQAISDSLTNKKQKIVRKPVSSFEDSLLVNPKTAVFFQPDSLQMEKIRDVNEKSIYESLMHDCHFEMKNAQSVIQRYWPNLRIVSANRYRWLIFRKRNGNSQRIDLNAINDICGIFLFDGTRDPVRANMPNISTELWNYFGESRR